MEIQDSKSDIEKLLASQTWKHKKLPSLVPERKNVKVRSYISLSKPRKSERIITQPLPEKVNPLTDNPPENSIPVCRNQESQSRFCNLAIPAFTQIDLNSAVPSRSGSFDYQIPIFPKSQFANSSKNLSFVPRFENLSCAHSGDIIREIKIDAGRLKKGAIKTHRRRFEFSEDLNKIKCEKQLKRMETII